MIGSIKEKKQLRQYYDNHHISSIYVEERFRHALGRVLHEKQISVVNKVIAKYNCQKILEVACGPARLTCNVMSGIYRLAIDSSQNMIDEARKRLQQLGHQGDWELQVADVFELGLDKRFDFIYSFRFIRHFTLKDRLRIYARIQLHLAPGGCVVFDVVNRAVSAPIREKDGLEKYPIYDELYKESQFREEMASVGWQVAELIPVHPRFEWLRFLQIYIAPRSDHLAYRFMSWLENHSNAKPLEWIAVCRCG